MFSQVIRKFVVTGFIFGLSAVAHAIPVTINMTADNSVSSGGICGSANCTDGQGWVEVADGTDFNIWPNASSVSLDLDTGTHWFAWEVTNTGTGSSGNPAGLLAEILWEGGANYSSAAWEIYDINTGAAIANATEYGANGTNIWGSVSGISTNANWIYGDTNFSEDTPESLWIRTSITIAEVPEPGSLVLMMLGLLGLGFARRRA